MSDHYYYEDTLVRVTLFDPETYDYQDLYFNVYRHDLSKRWLRDFLNISTNKSIKTANINFSSGDMAILRDSVNTCIKKINKFYDEKLELISKLDHDSLNILHEHYAVYGQKLDIKLQEKYWETAHILIPEDDPRAKVWPGIKFSEEMHFAFIELNNLIHKTELILASEVELPLNPEFVINISHDEKINHEFKEDDVAFLKPCLDFGDLCLGYNTLGKNIRHIVDDMDFSNLSQDLIFPQNTWSNEIFISMKNTENNPFWHYEYYHKWKKMEVDNHGYEFGNFYKNKEGYYCIGRLCSEQINEFYDYGKKELKKDLSNFKDVFEVRLVTKEQFQTEYKNPEVRFPQWLKPRQTLSNQEIKRIINGKTVVVTWILNNICNYACRYCPPNLHEGKNFKIEWEEVRPFVDHIIQTYSTNDRKIVFSLSGGEPTMSPFFPELIKRIYDTGHIARLTTNLSRTPRYIEENFKYLYSASCSFHPFFEFTNKTADAYLEKLKIASEHTIVTARIMMDPLFWQESLEFIEKIREDTWIWVEPVMIESQYGGYNRKLADIEYTEEQLDWFANFKYKRKHQEPDNANCNKIEIYRNFRGEALFEYADGEVEFNAHYQQLINNGQTKFFKWRCNAGTDSLYIGPQGEIKKANCNVGGVWGNKDKWQKINWERLTSPVICSQLECTCGSDIPIMKYKT